MAVTNPLPRQFWDRHANPKSGWSRLLATPVLIFALYARKWLLLGLTVLFLAVNPILFPEPDEPPTEDFMYQVVRAEEQYLSEGRPLFGLGYPAVLNVLSAAGSILALWSALRRNVRGTALGTALLMAGKLGFVNALVELYRESEGETGDRPRDT